MATDGERGPAPDGEDVPPVDEPRFQPVEGAGGFSADDAYRVLAGLPPEDPADPPAGAHRGYSRENAYRVLRGLPPVEEPVDGEP